VCILAAGDLKPEIREVGLKGLLQHPSQQEQLQQSIQYTQKQQQQGQGKEQGKEAGKGGMDAVSVGRKRGGTTGGGGDVLPRVEDVLLYFRGVYPQFTQPAEPSK
jgi:hypothetical protein